MIALLSYTIYKASDGKTRQNSIGTHFLRYFCPSSTFICFDDKEKTQPHCNFFINIDEKTNTRAGRPRARARARSE